MAPKQHIHEPTKGEQNGCRQRLEGYLSCQQRLVLAVACDLTLVLKWNPMSNILNKFLITYVSICFFSFLGVSAGEARMVLPVKSKKTEINWKSWSTDYEPLQITADHDDAIVIFRFEQRPNDPQGMRLTSNAAVYVETDSGLVPVSKRAKEKPNPNLKLKAED